MNETRNPEKYLWTAVTLNQEVRVHGHGQPLSNQVP